MGHCVVKNPAAGGGRWVEVPPERLVTWVITFAERHGGAATVQPATTGESGVAVTFTVTFTGADGATAAEVFGRYGPDRLDAVVLGGDKRSAAGLADDARLEKYLAKATGRFLTVPDPRLAVLRDIPRAFLATRIRLTEPESNSPATG